MKTKAMLNREQNIEGVWRDEGNGYYSMVGNRKNSFFLVGPLAYVAIPENHPLINTDYQVLENNVEVNGGLTFSDENVFGWDYLHAYNMWDIQGDIARAIAYFKSEEATSQAPVRPEATQAQK